MLKNCQIVIFQERKRLKDPEEIKSALEYAHDSPLSGHPGQNRMYEFLKRLYSWKGMKGDVKRFVNNCESCKMAKYGQRTQEKFVITDTPAQSFDIMSIDTVGPLPLTSSGNRYVLTAQCDLSKFVICVPLPDKSAKSVARAIFYRILMVFGPMKRLKTDMGTEYVNEVLKGLCEYLKIEKVTSTAYHPQTIGALERNHRVLNEYLRNCLSTVDSEWDNWVQVYAFAYNVMPNTSHRFTPFELVFGRRANYPIDFAGQVDPVYDLESYNKELKFRLQTAFARAKQCLENLKDKQKNNQLRVNPLEVKIGDKVKLRNENLENKLSKPYLGPYIIISIEGSNCRIKDESGREQLVHKNRLNLF